MGKTKTGNFTDPSYQMNVRPPMIRAHPWVDQAILGERQEDPRRQEVRQPHNLRHEDFCQEQGRSKVTVLVSHLNFHRVILGRKYSRERSKVKKANGEILAVSEVPKSTDPEFTPTDFREEQRIRQDLRDRLQIPIEVEPS